MYFWYKIFTYLFYPLSKLYLFFRKLKNKEDSTRYIEKLSKINLSRGEGFLIWFHVASVGEAMSVLPLIEKFSKEEKIKKILITSITLSSGKILKKRYNNNTKILHQFLPLDIPIYTKKFLDHWKPNLSIFIDSEIWPNLILDTKRRKIPLILVNARITEKSFLRWKLVINFAKKIFGSFDLCIASNKESEKFLEILGAKNIKNHGNIKFSNLNNKIDKDLKNISINDRKIWCAASTHNTEEILCGKAHLKIKEKYNNILTIIIPRHIERAEKIVKELSELNLEVVLSSSIEKLNKRTDILLVNSYGESIKYYKISKCVFLGKSLIKTLTKDSGQNPIEAARLGCKIIHGPNIKNFTEIYEYLKNYKITKQISNVDELSLSVVEELQNNQEKKHEIGKIIENHGQNILNNVIIEVKKYI